MYVFDTNSLIVLFNHFYLERFPSLWARFDDLIVVGRIVSVREVYNEILAYANLNSRLVQWAKAHRDSFAQPSLEEMQFVTRVFSVAHFRTLIRRKETLQGHPVADPFLVAKAKVENATLVTQEERRENAAKIPNVCEYFQIRYTNLEGFMETEGWQF
jgi:predicted nucleic acid-binding protein